MVAINRMLEFGNRHKCRLAVCLVVC